MTAIERLHAMFEADLGAMSDAMYYRAFPPYEGDAELGARPWFPPLSEVWTFQGEIPPDVRPEEREHWATAWALLARLYDDYLRARERRGAGS